MNKLRILVSFIIILNTLPVTAFAFFESVQIRTIKASVSFPQDAEVIPDVEVPQIVHAGLESISSTNKLAVIIGTATDNLGLQALEVNYYEDAATAISTSTVVLASAAAVYNFNVKLTLASTESKYFYYRIKAVDLNNNTAYWPGPGNEFHQVNIDSPISEIVTTAGGTVTMPDGNPDDGETSIIIPEGALDKDTIITITKVDAAEAFALTGNTSDKLIAAYKFEPAGLVFNIPVIIKLLYQDVNQDGLTDESFYREETLKIMWWDGFEWRFISDDVDTLLNLVSGKISHFSLYGIFSADSPKDEDYKPKERIITPATKDGKNDYATFSGLNDGDVVNIYDVTGRRIRQLKDLMIWNGKDDSGNDVEGGLYFYQIKTQGKTINGTIVVAK